MNFNLLSRIQKLEAQQMKLTGTKVLYALSNGLYEDRVSNVVYGQKDLDSFGARGFQLIIVEYVARAY